MDDLLARARLAPATTAYTQADIDAGQRRLAARLAAIPSSRPASVPDIQQQAASDLAALCETLVAQPGGLDSVAEFLTPSGVPGPHGARILGCLLALAAAQDSARFWWQYAAGAGDHPAAFCLALYHEAHGETAAATWWSDQAALPAYDDDQLTPAEEIRDRLRVLHRLRDRLPHAVSAAISYVPAAVGWVDDDLDLPLPDADFVTQLRALIRRESTRRDNCQPLPARASGQHWPPVRNPQTAG